MNYARHIAGFSIATLALLVAMFIISLLTGVSQQYIEVVQTYIDYEKALRQGEGTLRIILAIDGLFIASYWLLGIFLVLALWKEERKLLLALSAFCITATAVLDIVENSEFLMFLESLAKDLPIDVAGIQQLMVTSTVKWNFAYFAFLFLGFVFPTGTSVERTAALFMRYVQLPVGILVHTLPASAWLLAAHLARFGVLVLLLALLAVIAGKWKQRSAT